MSARLLLAASFGLGLLCAQTFEVASIRENPGPSWPVRIGYAASGPRLTLQVWSVEELIQEAFSLKRYGLAMPPGSPTAFYDITAKAEGDGALTREQFKPLLQKLLTDRFRLQFHRETRELPVYAMVAGKGGPKFHESDPEKPEKFYHGVNGRNQYMDFQQATMEMVANGVMGNGIDRPVIDKTGLTGKYDIRLEATPEFRINNNPQPEDLRVFEAIQQQLGLKLEPQQASIEVLVVDRIEKPSAN